MWEIEMRKAMNNFRGLEDCPENRDKLRALIKEYLPDVWEEDLELAITGVLRGESA